MDPSSSGFATDLNPGGDLSPLIWVLVLLFFAAYFAITETALASVSQSKIKAASDHGSERAEKVLEALENFDDAISTLLVCTNITHLAIAAIVTVFVTRTWGLWAVTLSTILTTVVVFFFGEMLPKSIAKKNSEKLALRTAGLLLVLMKILKPVSGALSAIGNMASRLVQDDPELSVTEDELIDIIEDMEEEGTLDEDSGELIQAAVEFSDIHAHRMMTKREDIQGIEASTPTAAILDIVQASTHSRIPIYEGNLDHIIGVLQVRDFMKECVRHPELNFNVKKILNDVYYVRRSMDADELLADMSAHKTNVAIVEDKDGMTLGLITIEDILEELVGEIEDEEEVLARKKAKEHSSKKQTLSAVKGGNAK